MTHVGYDPYVPEERFEALRVRHCGSTAAGVLEGVVEADRLTLINARQVAPRETLIVPTNLDMAGAIKRAGTTLGDAGVNIAGYHQAPLAQGGKALEVKIVDGYPGEAVRKLPTALPDATSATTIRFPPA